MGTYGPVGKKCYENCGVGFGIGFPGVSVLEIQPF